MPILVADGNPDTVTTQAILLQMAGYRVVPCFDGADVIKLIECQRPRAALLEIALPNVTGIDVVRALNERHVAIRPKLLIATTGYGDAKARSQTAAVGFNHHFLKPVEFARILDVLRVAGIEPE